jgi:hypothetical protein
MSHLHPNTPPESTTQTLKSAIPLPESIVQPVDLITLPSDLSTKPPESTVLPTVPSLVPSPLCAHALPEPALEPAVSSWGQRLRKANVLSLNMCMCGVNRVMITDSEIDTGTNIMKC